MPGHDLTLKPNIAAAISPEFFKAAFDYLPVGIAVICPETLRFRYVNAETCKLTGYRETALLEMFISELFHPDDISSGIAVLQLRESETHEKRLIRKDGETVWVKTSMNLAPPGETGKPYIVATVEDITRQKLSETQEIDTAAKFNSVLENISDAVVIANEQGIIEHVNRSTGELFGFVTDELIGRDLTILMSVQDAKAYTDVIRGPNAASVSKIIGGAPREILGVTKNGDAIPIKLAVSEIDTEGGRRYVGTMRNMSETSQRIRAEESLKIRNRAIEASNSGIFITDAQQSGNPVLYVNPSTKNITGRNESSVLGKSYQTLFGKHLSDAKQTEINSAIEQGRASQTILKSARSDGTEYWVELRLAPVASDEGAVINYVGIINDITDRIRTEEHLVQAQKMEAVGQLTGGIAHDFNNLLTVVMGSLQLLQRRFRDDEKASRQLQMSLTAAQRGATLTKQLLAFSRRQVLEPSTIDLKNLVTSFVPILRQTLGEFIEIETKLPARAWPVNVDEVQMESAILNLAVNARDAMPDGGKLTISLGNCLVDADTAARHEMLSPGYYVRLTVSDTGHGMPPDTLEKAFDPFFTTKEVGKGTGLGLSMVFGFAKQSGGHAQIRSEIGAGTTIEIFLPHDGSGNLRKNRKSANKTSAPGVQRDTKILIVEDEESVRETVAEILKDADFTVAAEENSQKALKYLAEHDDVDLLLTDVVMPGELQGPELVRIAQSMRPHIRVMITSGFPRDSDTLKHLIKEDIAFIQKPYQEETLIERIQTLLDGVSGQ